MILAFEQGLADQVFVHSPGAFTSFADSPYNKGLPPAHVTCCEYLGDIRLIVFFGRFDIAAVIELDAEFIQQTFTLRRYKTHSQESQFAGKFSFASGHFDELCGSAFFGKLPFEVDDFQRFQVAFAVADKFFGSQGPLTFRSFFMRRGSL